jgi:hypothetical protein
VIIAAILAIIHPTIQAVWWIERVLRYPDHDFWRSPVHDLGWVQYFLLDVILTILVAMALVIFMVYKLVLWLLCGRGGQRVVRHSDQRSMTNADFKKEA